MCEFLKKGCPFGCNKGFSCKNVKRPTSECFDTLLRSYRHLKREHDFLLIKHQQLILESDLMRTRLKYENNICYHV